MARVMHEDDVNIYRMKVEIKLDGGKVITKYYGPHDASCQARDHSLHCDLNPKRLTKQMLRPDENCQLYWCDFKVTYRNGGELVDWDA